MHVYTLVITPGPRRSAVARAGLLLTQAVPRSFDYWGTGGRFEDRLGTVQRPEIAAWYAAQAKRLERFEADHPPTDDSTISRELGDPAWSSVERPHVRTAAPDAAQGGDRPHPIDELTADTTRCGDDPRCVGHARGALALAPGRMGAERPALVEMGQPDDRPLPRRALRGGGGLPLLRQRV